MVLNSPSSSTADGGSSPGAVSAPAWGDAHTVEAMLEWVFRDSPDAILLTAPDGRILRANPAATQLLGWREDEIRAGGRELVVDTSDPRLPKALQERKELGSVRCELLFRHRDGTVFPADVSSAIFETREGPRTAMVIRDLRPQRALEDRLAHERERYRLLAENAQDIVYRYVLEPRRGFEYVSPAVTRLTGYSPEDHYADPDLGSKILHPDDRARLEAISSGTSRHVVVRWVRKDGTILWTEHSATLIRNDEGRVVAIEGIARDVTERRQMEEQLERERAHLRLLSEASASMGRSLDFEATLSAIAHAALPGLADYCLVDLVDEHGEFKRIVAAAADPEKESALRDSAALRGPRADGAHPAAVAFATQKPVVIPEIPDSLFEALVPDDAARREIQARLPAGSAIAVPLSAQGHRFGSLLVSAVERGALGPEQVQVVEELGRRASVFLDNARLYRNAQLALSARDEVLAIVAHDLRNPLNAIAVRAQILAGKVEPELRRGAQLIQRDVQRMSALIQDLLDVARLEAGVLRIEPVVDTPERLASDAREMLQPLADEVSRRGGEVQFCVSDQGPGIPSGQLEHIFERFWQGGSAKDSGLGLGLSITRALVELHGGRTWAESTPGVGTRMHFTLPGSGSPGPRPVGGRPEPSCLIDDEVGGASSRFGE